MNEEKQKPRTIAEIKAYYEALEREKAQTRARWAAEAVTYERQLRLFYTKNK